MATTEWRRISVTVGGNDLTAFLYGNDQTATLPDGPEVGRASITLRYDAEVDALGINDWDEVIIKAGITSATVTVWGGYVTRQSKEPASEMGGNVVINTLDCQSYAIRLVTTQPIEATFNDDVAGDPTQDYDIVGELVNTYLPTFYDSGSISGLSAVVISYIAFTGDNLRQALQKVVNLTRKEYGVTPDKKVYYRPAGGGTTYAYKLSETPDGVTTYPLRGKPVYDIDSIDLRNKIRVVGGWTYSEIVTDSWSGNGSNKIFSLTHKPSVVINVTVSGVDQHVGIDFVDDPADFDVLVNYDTAKLKFTVAPASFAPIVCYYRYNVRPDVTVEDSASVAAIGMTLWAPTLRDDSLSGTADAAAAGSAYLAQQGTTLYRAQLTTVHSGTAGGTIVPWTPGGNVYLEINAFGFTASELMTIKGVTLRAEDRPGGAGYCLVHWDLDLGSRLTLGQQVANSYSNTDVINQAYPPLMLSLPQTGMSPVE